MTNHDKTWHDCGEGPFSSRAAAEQFERDEVGAESRVVENGSNEWIVEIVMEDEDEDEDE